MTDQKPPSHSMLIAAFAAVYIIWGSTYLAIRYAIETIPPFLMAGSRFFAAGMVLYAWLRFKGAPRPPASQWGASFLIGALLLFGGNGGVSWAEQRVPSGIAALVVSLVPVWMAVIGWFWGRADKPRRREFLGVLMGFGGVAMLAGPANLAAQGADPVGIAVLMTGSFTWAFGSILSRHIGLPSQPLMATALEMIGGGALLLAVGTFSGEIGRFDPARLSLLSAGSLLYLTVFGSLVAFSAYTWLLKVSRPALVATYAYVNPVVAVFLGWWIGHEGLTARTLTGAAIIVAAVVLITTPGRRTGSPKT